MKILIVDNNKNNRMLLSLLLNDYMDENEGVTFFIEEAEDAQVAIEMCETHDFDLILMDIMMLNKDGIQATKIIKKKYPNVMIIAVSGVDDSESKKRILKDGIEDFMAKPLNTDIITGRIENYMALTETRKNKKVTSDVCVNLFTKNIFSRHTRFIITSEDSLAEFWEFYLLSEDMKCDILNDVVRTVYAIAELQKRLNINSDIFVEDSDTKRYFTLSNIGDIPQKSLELTLKKNHFIDNYKIENEKISFELEKIYSIPPSPPKKELEIVNTEAPILSSKELTVFDYLDPDDLFDLEEYANKLSSIMLIVGVGGITEEEVLDIYTYLDKLGSILASYSEVYPIAQALSQLSADMSAHTQEFIDNSEALGAMCEAFSHDMSNWIEMSFHTGAPSADFMNDTIVVNSQTIGGMLTMNEPVDASDDVDDIFDF